MMDAGRRLSSFFICILALGAATLQTQAAPEAKSVPIAAQVGGDKNSTRFVAFLSKSVDFRVFPLVDPYRLVVDLPEVDIQVPGDVARGLVLSSRAGLLTAGKSRIVIDLAEPALVEKSEILPAQNGVPARLVIDIVKTSFKKFAASSRTPPPVEIKPAIGETSVQSRGDRRIAIVIDAGHGGLDAGAHGRVTNTAEKDVTLDFCNKLREHIEQNGKLRIVPTRTADEFVPLDERAQVAIKEGAAFLISIHADSVDQKVHGAKGTQSIFGASIHTLSDKASDEQAKATAISENAADAKGGLQTVSATEVSDPAMEEVREMENRTKRNRSLSFSNYLADKMRDKIRLNANVHRYGNLRVLKAQGVPSVLIELGYLSNDDDEKLLISPEWRLKTSKQLADAIIAFVTERQVQLPQ